MKVPQNESFKDINSNTLLPVLNKTQIRQYLNFTNKKFEAASQLYESRFLIAARSCIVGENTYLKGICKKTMKNLQYEVDIKLDPQGNTEEAHCECAAGSGINATCKHVAVLLLAVEHMVRENIILKFEACTEKLQQFHVPKRQYTGTPVRTEKLSRRKSKHSILFEPYDISRIDKENYNCRIRNLVLNFPNSNMAMKQLYEPANPYALETDHCYTNTNPTKKLLEDLKLSQISEAEITEIEEKTRGQSHSVEWHDHRRHRLTSSNFHTMCHLRETTMEKYASELIDRSPFHSRATSHGIVNEEIALKKYCHDFELQVEPCGLFISKERPFLAASPDGLLGDETIIEIKCPYTCRNLVLNNTRAAVLYEQKILQSCSIYI
ncbi:uncharacterized protein LOC105385367 [Plutella xylostella]|uniref:uncharacterized protein LOC105385367 n=1 Tax=Plutella xylostella TaxID=51655 RepID=UPI0020323B15|nr:uncharacterized protein LOC105385367 [Plutella xylostella]